MVEAQRLHRFSGTNLDLRKQLPIEALIALLTRGASVIPKSNQNSFDPISGHVTWGQSYKDFLDLRTNLRTRPKACVNAMRQIFVCQNVRALLPNIFIGLHFYF